jgi:hypothetical protein
MKRLDQDIGGSPATTAGTTTSINSNGTKGKAKDSGTKRKRANKLKEEESYNDEPATKKISEEDPMIKDEAEFWEEEVRATATQVLRTNGSGMRNSVMTNR